MSAEIRIVGLSNAQAKSLFNGIDEMLLNDILVEDELTEVKIEDESVKANEEGDDIYTFFCTDADEIEEEEEEEEDEDQDYTND